MTWDSKTQPGSSVSAPRGLSIGLVYDLRSEYLASGYSEEETAEFDQEGTIEALEGTLRRLGHHPERVGHVGRLWERLSQGRRWDLVFNIAEGLYGYGREALVPALLDQHRIPYTFADPLVCSTTLHKATAKQLVRDAGLPTPDFALVEAERDLETIALELPLFVKPVAEGTGKGITPASVVRDEASLRRVCLELLEHFRQPVLVETLLPGRELTVGILGTGREARSLGTLEVVLRPEAEAGVYSYVNKERCEELVDYVRVSAAEDDTVLEAESVALAAWRVLGGRDGGRIDLRCDAHGRPSFLEANPLAGLHPEHSDLPILATRVGMSYPELIDEIVRSASSRIAQEVTEHARRPASQLG